jgi:hypothetical protein
MADLSAMSAYQNSMNNSAMKNLYDILGKQDDKSIFSGGTARDQAAKVMDEYNKRETEAANTDKSEVDPAEGAKTATAANIVGASDKLYTYGADLMQNAKNAESGKTIGEVSASTEKGKPNLSQSIKDFVANYNKTLDEAKAGSKNGSLTNGDAKKIKNLLDTTSAYEKKLSEMGITIGSDNKLSINSDKLANATTDQAKELFSGAKSYGANILRRADSLTGYTASAYDKNIKNAYAGGKEEILATEAPEEEAATTTDDSGLSEPTSPVQVNASEEAAADSTPGASVPAEEAAAGTKPDTETQAAAGSVTKQAGYVPPRSGGYDPIAEAERRAAERAEAAKVKAAAGVE